MNKYGTDIWCKIIDSITDDDDHNMVDLSKSKSYITESGGWEQSFAFMTPYKKLNIAGLDYMERAFVAIATASDRGTNTADQIRKVDLIYHFFNQDAVDRFLDRLSNLIEAAEL